MDKKLIEETKQITENLFKTIDLPVKLNFKEDKDTIIVNIETENPGLLIGFHGETLSAIQLIVSLMVYKKTGSWTHISLNVGDYRERREDQIKEILQRTIEIVKNTKQPLALPYFPSNERRIVHLLIEDNNDIIGESEGEGINRRIVIKPKIG